MNTAPLARERLSDVLAMDRAVRAAQPVTKPSAAAHEATRPTRQRKLARDWGSANRIVSLDAKQLRDSARQRDRDHDVSRNALNILVQNTVGSGIDVTPAPRQAGSGVNRVLAQQLRDLWDEWWDRPEVTWKHDFGKCQQLIARSVFRDGEGFFQQLVGPVDFLDHGTRVPYSIEMIEADLVPLDFNDPANRILQGIKTNAWGRPVTYYVYKQHPGDFNFYNTDTKPVAAEQLQHVALIDRMHQGRGLSVFASVLNRLVDIGDYEDSERIAAKVAASLCAQITKGDATSFDPNTGKDDPLGASAAGAAALDRAYRSLTMVPGMIGDDLLPGESIEILDSKRPNPNVSTYVNDQLRRAAGGFGASASALTRNFDGSYSAQRQELVEQWGAYAMLGEQFIARVMRPIWNSFVQAAVLGGLVSIPRGWKLREVCAATFVRPVMPWIDPLKEALARAELEDRGWQAPQQSILQVGNDPEEVRRLREDWISQGGAAVLNPAAVPTAPVDPGAAQNARRALARSMAIQENE